MPPSNPVNGDLRNRNGGGGSERGQKDNQQPRVAEDKPRHGGFSWIWGVWPLIAVVIVVGVVLYMLLRHVAPPACYPESRDETCYEEGKKGVYRMYGTKTDYRVLVSKFELDKQNEYVVPGCTPRGLFLFNRHTTRFPDRDDIVKMIDALPRLQSNLLAAARNNTVHLCKSDIHALSNWTLQFKPEDDNHVTPSGRNVSFDQAKRFLAMFPKIFSPFRASDYVVAFTSRVRTKETAQAFLQGVLSPTEYSDVERNFLPPQDDILQFHKECDQISKGKARTPEAVEAFEKGPYWKRLLDTLSWRLGFTVTKADLKMLLRACQFEFAIFDTSPWCALFTEDDLKAVEFREDLDDYYKDGYGRERNYAQACPVVKELISRLEEMSNDTSKPNKVLFFSHAGGFKKVVARLGLYRDSKAPTADGLCTQADRQWQSSLLCPFNANLVFVLFSCPNNQHEVVTFLNERPQQLPGCPSHRCPLETFVNTFKGHADSCNLTQICERV